MAICFTLSIIRYVSRVKWSNPGKVVAPSPTLRCSRYWKGNLRIALDYGCQFYLLYCSSTKLALALNNKDRNINQSRRKKSISLLYSIKKWRCVAFCSWWRGWVNANNTYIEMQQLGKMDLQNKSFISVKTHVVLVQQLTKVKYLA